MTNARTHAAPRRGEVPGKLPGALALLALTLVFCHNAFVYVDAGQLVPVGDGGTGTKHHDAGVDAGDSGNGIVTTIPDASVMVTSLAPARGPVAGGTTVNILGGGFLTGAAPADPSAAATVTRVTFGGNNVLNVLVLSDDELQVASPAGDVGPADVVVVNPNGSKTCSGCFDYLTTIEIDSVTPGTGPIKGGTPITVIGLGFDSKTVLTVGGRGAIASTFVDPEHLTATTPPGNLPGRADVRAFNQNGTSLLYGAFTYVAAPTLTSLSPVLGPIAGGTTVTLTGAGFLGEQVAVTVGGTAATQVTVLDDATLTFATPAGAAGSADVTVTDGNGTATLTGGFVYFDPASTTFALLGVVPSSGPASGSASANLVGTGFPASFSATFGTAAAATATGISANLATVAVPAGTPGSVAVTIDNGAANSKIAAGYTYLPARAITSIAPSSGPSAGGTAVTITGVGFQAGDQLFIGPEAAVPTTFVSATELTATTPPGSAGPNDLLVLNSTGKNPALLSAGFSYVDALSLIQLAPSSGSQSGGTYVELLGTGFSLGDTATFGPTPGTDFQLLDGFTLACTTPAGQPGPVNVTVNAPNGGGSSTLAGGFSYFNPGSTAGGQSGGPLDGTLNVTAMSEYSGGGSIPGAGVRLGLDPQTPFQGFTDANGQITFSDPSIVKAQTVTVTYGSTAVTIDDVTQQNLTVLLPIYLGSGQLPTPCACSKNGEPADCPDNCNLPYCSIFGSCVQCLADSDCVNPNLPGYDPNKPRCNDPGLGGSCVHCTADSDCTGDPNGNLACDDARGSNSTFTCVQCTNNTFCTGTQYCNTNAVVCVNADVLSGNVYGFKLPSNITLAPTQHTEAHVGLLQPTVFDFEPFSQGVVQEAVVAAEGDGFSFQIDDGQLDLSLYAKFGIVDNLTGTFTPVLLGLARGISVDPLHPATNITILLDTHLDQSAPIEIQNQLTPPPGGSGQPVSYDTFSFLDLGQDGVVPLSDVVSISQNATLGSLPPVQGNGVLFLTQAFENPAPPQTFTDPSQRTPYSVFFRQVDTDFTQGVQVGPLQPFVQPLHPLPGATLDGIFSWSFAGSTPAVPLPDLTEVAVAYEYVIDEGNGQSFTGSQTLWQIIVPGSQTEVQVPADILSGLLQGVPQSSPGFQVFLFWVVETAQAPRFDYSFFSYTDLSVESWTSFQATEQLASP